MVVVRRVLELMLFRRGPQDLPGDQITLAISVTAYCIMLCVQALMLAPPFAAAAQALLVAVLMGLYLAAILRLKGLMNRFIQTATGLFASGAVLTLLSLAPTQAFLPFARAVQEGTDPSQAPMPPTVALLAYAVVGIWGLAIYSHIYRHALDASIYVGVGAALGFQVFVFLLSAVI